MCGLRLVGRQPVLTRDRALDRPREVRDLVAQEERGLAGVPEAWLERYNYASLSNTAAHEAMPGHWLHSTYMRRTPGKVRRIWIGLNPFPQLSSGQDGWAHYAEQMSKGAAFSMRDFHERVMTNGIAPIWAHRQLLLPGDTSTVID